MKFPFKSVINRYLYSTSGSVVALTGLTLPVVLTLGALGVDVSIWMMNKRDLQTAADAAVLAVGWEMAHDTAQDMALEAGEREAIANGYRPADNGTIQIDVSEEDDVITITAVVSQSAPLFFGGLLTDGDVMLGTAAASAIIETPGDFCLLSLDESADGAFEVYGNANIDSGECGIAVNSDSATALDIWGNAEIIIGDVSVAGDYEQTGSTNFDYQTMKTDAPRVPDPYEDLEVPEFAGCTKAQMNKGPVRVTGNVTFTPDDAPFCGGLKISSNAQVTFEPGVYVVDGGDFEVTGNSRVAGEGVSFVLTNSGGSSYGRYGDIHISGNDRMALSAPAEGEEMEGVLFYQDRNAPSSTGPQCNDFTGNSDLYLSGAVYLPSRCLIVTGNHGSNDPDDELCTRIIAKTIQFSGNADLTMTNNCQSSAAEDIGTLSVRLVL
jgi:hypothetical protein